MSAPTRLHLRPMQVVAASSISLLAMSDAAGAPSRGRGCGTVLAAAMHLIGSYLERISSLGKGFVSSGDASSLAARLLLRFGPSPDSSGRETPPPLCSYGVACLFGDRPGTHLARCVQPSRELSRDVGLIGLPLAGFAARPLGKLLAECFPDAKDVTSQEVLPYPQHSSRV